MARTEPPATASDLLRILGMAPQFQSQAERLRLQFEAFARQVQAEKVEARNRALGRPAGRYAGPPTESPDRAWMEGRIIAVDPADPRGRDRSVYVVLDQGRATRFTDEELQALLGEAGREQAEREARRERREIERSDLCDCPACMIRRLIEHQVEQRPVPQVSEAEALADLRTILPSIRLVELRGIVGELREGRLDGNHQELCFFGVVARMRRSEYGLLGLDEHPERPFEVWLLRNVRRGATPQNNAAAATLERWLLEEIGRREAEGGEEPLTLKEWLKGDDLVPAPDALRLAGWATPIRRSDGRLDRYEGVIYMRRSRWDN